MSKKGKTMKCPRCEHLCPDTARYCEQCGSLLRCDDPSYPLADAYRLELAGKLNEAVATYEKLLEGPCDQQASPISKHLGNIHFRLGHLKRAKAHLARACELDPSNATYWHDLGVVQYHMTDFEGAEESLRNALERDPDLHLAYFWLGNALYHKGEYEEAKKAFHELLERYPNFAIARFHLGVIYSREGNREAATKEFCSVLLKNPEDAVARFYVRREIS